MQKESPPLALTSFRFYIFATENYPNEPPKFHLPPTGGGEVHMNPNLYNNGHGKYFLHQQNSDTS
jgi:hypothetical protein